MAEMRSYVSGNFGLNLDGKSCGFVKSVSGGAISAEVVTEKIASDHVAHKHLAAVKYEEFCVDFGFSMEKPVYDWIAASWEAKYERKNGSIVAYDYALHAKSEREFLNALISETVIPTLDGSAKDAGYLTIKFAPELIRAKQPSGKAAAPAKAATKPFLRGNFKLEIDGLDATKVNKIDSFSVTQDLVEEAVGEARDYVNAPAKLTFPNLRISMPQASAEKWFEWFEDFVVRGNSTQDKEKNGTLTFLSPDRKTALAQIKLQQLGIFRISEDAATAAADTIHRVVAELYCEKMQFVPPKTGAK